MHYARLARFAVLSLAAAIATGCGAFGAILYKVTPEAEIQPQFKLADVPTVVMVENFANPDLVANDAELVARSLNDELIQHKVVKTLIKAEKVLDLRNSRPKDYLAMSVPQVAAAVGAEQVIYVDFQGGGITSLTGRSMFQGRGAANVKVIDAKTGQTLWPAGAVEGAPLTYQTPDLAGREEGSYLKVRSMLYGGLAKRVGRLFHKWKASEDDDERLGKA